MQYSYVANHGWNEHIILHIKSVLFLLSSKLTHLLHVILTHVYILCVKCSWMCGVSFLRTFKVIILCDILCDILCQNYVATHYIVLSYCVSYTGYMVKPRVHNNIMKSRESLHVNVLL